MSYHLLGLDLGGTKLTAALADTDCRLIRKVAEPVADPRNVAKTLDALADLARRVTEGLPPASILGVGIACSGLVDRHRGVLVSGPNLGWRDVPVLEEMRQRLHPWDVFVGNDVNLAALGEWQEGAGQGSTSMLAVFVGTGIGAGVVLDGRLYEGANGFAGEIGHIVVSRDSAAVDGAGMRGSVEALASGPALALRAAEALRRGERSILALDGSGLVSPAAIGEAEAGGDALALRLVGEAADALGFVIAAAVHLLDPDRIVLGGGVVRGIPTLVPRIHHVARGMIIPEMAGRFSIVPALLAREASLIGGLALARHAGQLAEPSVVRR